MRIKFFYILFILFISQTYSQNSNWDEIRINKRAQLKFKDTIKNIEENLNGKWKYLGKKIDNRLIDTITRYFGNGKKSMIIVENGEVSKINENKSEKQNFYYQITFNFINNNYYYENKIYIEKNRVSMNSCEPFPEVIFYKKKFGVLFTEMLGNYFKEIKELTFNKLIFDNGEVYMKIE